MAAKRYRLLEPLSYPPNGKGQEKAVEAGKIVSDLPAKSVPWLLEQGRIEAVAEKDGE